MAMDLIGPIIYTIILIMIDLNNGMQSWINGLFIGTILQCVRDFTSLLFTFLQTTFIVTEQYELSRLQNNTSKLILLKTLEECFWQGYTFIGARRVGVGLGIHFQRGFIIYTKFIESKGTSKYESKPDDNISVQVYRLRHGVPLIPDDVLKGTCTTLDNDGNALTVFRYSGRAMYYIQPSVEIAIPRSCPTLIFSSFVSDQIANAYKKNLVNNNNQGGYVLAGKPGCGKSIAARILAHKLDAVLAYYNPTSTTGDTIDIFLDALMSSRYATMILVMEEIDIDLEKMVQVNKKKKKNKDNDNDNDNDYMYNSSFDKKHWCTLFDRLQFYPNVIPIATTNKRIEWLTDLDTEHFQGALFRKGRFSALIDCDKLSHNTKQIKVKFL